MFPSKEERKDQTDQGKSGASDEEMKLLKWNHAQNDVEISKLRKEVEKITKEKVQLLKSNQILQGNYNLL